MKGNPLPLALSLLAVFSMAAFAQVPAAPAAPAAVAPADPAAVAPAELAAPAAEPTEAPAAEPEAAPAPEPAPVAVPEPVAPVAPVAPPVAAPAAPEPSVPASYKFGVRAGLGISHFRNHAALRIVKFDGSETGAAADLNPGIGLSAGLAMEIAGLLPFRLAPEINYALYRSNNEIVSEKGKALKQVHRMGVYMHALEIPVLARFSVGPAYAELGPQLDFNLYSAIYKNGNYYRPRMNIWGAGVAAGGGVKIMEGTSLGARLHCGFREYATDVKGIPVSFQINVNHFVF